MKTITTAFACLGFSLCVMAQPPAPGIVTSDIGHFWEAYDKIITTRDSALQHQYLRSLYLEKGSPGLKAFMERKNYTAASYIEAINGLPLFWQSVRANTLKADAYAAAIGAGIERLKKIYPAYKPAGIYFTIGALMSGGTTLDDRVLIGAEIAMADSTAVTTGMPGWLAQNLRPFFNSNPVNHLVFLNVHEAVHTQQRPQGGYNLLAQCLYEGVAEFVAVKAMGLPSPTPAIAYGQAHNNEVRSRFAQELFSPFFVNWLYNNFNNEFKTRDLGYYTGYAICEKFYAAAKDKQQAIRTLIELDYGNPAAIENFVEKTGYFTQPLSRLKQQYAKARPKISALEPFKNGSVQVPPGTTRITIRFSTVMDTCCRNFELGDGGMQTRVPIQRVAGFSADGRSITLEVALQPDHQYELVAGSGFRTPKGIRLEPYLIRFKTAGR